MARRLTLCAEEGLAGVQASGQKLESALVSMRETWEKEVADLIKDAEEEVELAVADVKKEIATQRDDWRQVRPHGRTHGAWGACAHGHMGAREHARVMEMLMLMPCCHVHVACACGMCMWHVRSRSCTHAAGDRTHAHTHTCTHAHTPQAIAKFETQWNEQGFFTREFRKGLAPQRNSTGNTGTLITPSLPVSTRPSPNARPTHHLQLSQPAFCPAYLPT